MRSLKILTEYRDTQTHSHNSKSIYWNTLDEETDGHYLLCVMLVKELELEDDAPLGFNHKNHTSKYKIGLYPTGQGLFEARVLKGNFNKPLVSLALRCFISAWETWRDMNFSGINFGSEIDEKRQEWFPAPENSNEKSGDLNLVLQTTNVLKLLN